MALDDLDLEFEDEEDLKKKKSDAVQVDVDLVFQSETPQNRPQRPPQGGQGNVHPLPERPVARPAAPARPQPVTQDGGHTATAFKMPPREATKSQKDLMEYVRKVEFEAEVKVRVADFKAEILGEILGDMKFMEHQIGQLLARINNKHPESKQEILMIKKILADFTAKKRK